MEALEARRQLLAKTEIVDRYDLSSIVSVVSPSVVDEAVRTQKHALTFTGMDASDAEFVRNLAATLHWEDVPVSNRLVVCGPLTDIVSLHPDRSKDAVRILSLQDTSLGADVPLAYPKVEEVTVHDSGEGKELSLMPLNGWTAGLKRLSVYASTRRGVSLDGLATAVGTLFVHGRVAAFPTAAAATVSSWIWSAAKEDAPGTMCTYLESRPSPLTRLEVSTSDSPMPMRRLLTSHPAHELVWRDALKNATVVVATDEKKNGSGGGGGAKVPYKLLHLFSHSASVAFLSSRLYQQLKLGSIESFGICTPLYSTLPALQLLNGQLIPWRMLWDHVLNESNQSLRALWIEVPQGSHLDDTFLYLKMLLDMVLAFLSRVPKAQQPISFAVNLKPHTAPTDTHAWSSFAHRLIKMYTDRAGIPARTRLDALLDAKEVAIARVKVELDWMQLHCDSTKAIADVARAIDVITDGTRKEVLYPLRQHPSWFNYTVLTSSSFRANVSLHTLAVVVHSE